MVEQSHTTPLSICKEYLSHPLGLTLSTPGRVVISFVVPVINSVLKNVLHSLVSKIITVNRKYHFHSAPAPAARRPQEAPIIIKTVTTLCYATLITGEHVNKYLIHI